MGDVEQGVLGKLAQKARSVSGRVVFPEGADPTIVAAARKIKDEGYAEPVLLRNPTDGDLDGIESIEIGGGLLAEFVADYATETGFPEAVAESFFVQPLFFAAMMVRRGLADAMVAGIAHATEDVIMASEMIIGLLDGVETPSSFFLMDIPGWQGSEGSLLIFADCAVNPDPTSAQLADIATVTARNARTMFGFDPRVALLSFSTKGSADHAAVHKVTKAVELLKEQVDGQSKAQSDGLSASKTEEPAEFTFAFDGELQADAALIASVASKKVSGAGSDENTVAGQANVLIFPDLDAGNIAYKLVQRLAKAAAYGPVLQGFEKPVSDLSRGAGVDDVVGATIMAISQIQGKA